MQKSSSDDEGKKLPHSGCVPLSYTKQDSKLPILGARGCPHLVISSAGDGMLRFRPSCFVTRLRVYLITPSSPCKRARHIQHSKPNISSTSKTPKTASASSLSDSAYAHFPLILNALAPRLAEKLCIQRLLRIECRTLGELLGTLCGLSQPPAPHAPQRSPISENGKAGNHA